MNRQSLRQQLMRAAAQPQRIDQVGDHAGAALAPPSYGIDALDRTANEHAPIQRQAATNRERDAAQASKVNHTGMPDALKAGVERLSGLPMDDVRVHYNSSRPAQLQALAYTQGTNIHVGPGQERHLPHEAWHVVQQKQGRVQATMQMKGVAINADVALEQEAQENGQQASRNAICHSIPRLSLSGAAQLSSAPIQRRLATIDDIDPLDLSTHKTAINGDIAEGRGAQVAPGKQLKTHITWGALHSTGEGTSVTCDPIGPDHPLGSPTSGSKGISKRVKPFNTHFNGTWKQGHLLNAHLGGPGDEPKNLVAISQSTNTAMSNGFEDHLQRRINDHGEWMHFTAEVTHKKMKTKNATDLFSGQRYWAQTIEASWGAVDEDGHKTGDTKSTTLTAPAPVERTTPAPTTGVAPSTVASGRTTASATTAIGAEDVILDSEVKVANQKRDKEAARTARIELELSQAGESLMDELETPPSPLRQQEYVDTVMTGTYPTHAPLHTFTEGSRITKWQNTNRKKHSTEPYYIRDLASAVKTAKSKPENAYPSKLGRALKANLENKKLDTALAAADKEYATLGQKVKGLRGMVLHLEPEDFKRLVDSFYEQDPTSFKKYVLALEANL